ncbi:MAG TPA: 16S rRNA (cytidine(1402)-2'-O)-methyltransferase [Candidatus Baltobacteraceae bacterium]|nr:16S rRNA (cytidine(1402)-2'-O)-methyltransferase [Candidatus Baltobacteraceae bacterium]
MPLVFVPTPLGNLRDITLRARDALASCALLVAEDSRVARKLLNALELPGKEIWTYHEHNARSATAAILDRALTETVCVVTDAGTPGISDPGSDLVAAARENGVAVDVLPGPSALIGAAVLSGFPLRRFVFEGFAPRAAAQRKRAFQESLRLGIPSVWYESPQRIRKALNDLEEIAPSARVFLLREYTKKFEQQIAGTPSEVAARLPEPVLGEIALVMMAEDAAPEPAEAAEVDLTGEIDALLADGLPVSAIAKQLSDRGLGERRHVYAQVSERKRAGKESPHGKG